MSKLLDTFEKIDRGSPTPLGFGVSARAEKVPTMAIVGLVSKDHSEMAAVLQRVKADGVLIQDPPKGSSLKKIAKTLGALPWGLRLQGVTEEAAQSYREAGCDFLALSLELAHLGALGDKETAYFIFINADIDVCSLRAIQELPVDGVLLSMGSVQPPLTLQNLLSVGVVRGNISKHLLLEVPPELSIKELEGLRDMGVDGLVLDMGTTSEEALGKLRTAVMELPKQRPPREEKSSAILPQSFSVPSGGEPPDEEEDF